MRQLLWISVRLQQLDRSHGSLLLLAWQNQIPGMLHFPNPGSILGKLFLPSTHRDCVLSDLCPIGFPKFYDCIYRIPNIPLNIWCTQPASKSNEERRAVVYWTLTTCHALRQSLCGHYLVILPSHLWDGICYYVYVTEGKNQCSFTNPRSPFFFFCECGILVPYQGSNPRSLHGIGSSKF